jgi:hypothetical protein
MTQVTQFFQGLLTVNFAAHAALMIVFSAAVRSMPAPKPTGNQFYLWLYGFAQLIGANLDKTTITAVAPPAAPVPAASPNPAILPAPAVITSSTTIPPK